MSEPIIIQLREEDGEVTEECVGTLYVKYAGRPKVMVEMAIEELPRLEHEDELWVYFECDDPEHPAIPRMFTIGDGHYLFAAIGCDTIEERYFDEDDSPLALARFAQVYAAAWRIVERAKEGLPVFYGYRDLERHQDYMSRPLAPYLATEPPPDPRPRRPGKRR